MGGAASTPSWSSRRLPGTSLPPVRISLHDRPTPPARAVASERSLASEGGAGTPRGGRDDAAKTELRRQHSSPALKADADLRRDSLEAAPRHSTSAAPRHSGSPARRNSPSLSLRSGLLSVRRPTVTPRTAREVGEAMATEATGEAESSHVTRRLLSRSLPPAAMLALKRSLLSPCEDSKDEAPFSPGEAQRRRAIYAKVDFVARPVGVAAVPEPAAKLISAALADMFFLGSAMFAEMQHVVSSFVPEEFEGGAVVLREGDAGNTMFIIERGSAKIFRAADAGAFSTEAKSCDSLESPQLCVGVAKVGDIVGELALLYGARRAASVVAEPGGLKVWSLTRDRFKTLAAVADAREISLRAVNLRAIPTFASLSRRQIYLLARAMKATRLGADASLAVHDKPTDACYLIESGTVHIEIVGKHDVVGSSSRTGPRPVESVSELRDLLFPHGTETQAVTETAHGFICSAGTLVGVSVLLAAADSKTPHSTRTRICPHNVKICAGAAGCGGSTLSVAHFLAQLGSLKAALGGEADDCASYSKPNYVGLDSENGDAPPQPFRKLRLADFLVGEIVGLGTYGAVWAATARESSAAALPAVAIKHMSKQRVVFKQQLAHVHDERRLLAQVTHPNIVRLFGAFQDQASVYLVTELVEGPDVWSLVYDPRGAGFSSQGKLCDASDDLLRFYAACISLALAHLHDLGVVFRDLKPENLMVSKRGYLKLVDFGFAKLLPYYTSNAFAAKDDATLNAKDRALMRRSRGTPRPSNAGVGLAAHFKTYTMYIPPEIINGSGHDWSADTWAAACVFHELFSGFTPFVEPGHGPRAATIFKRVLALQFKPLIPPFRVARRKHASTLILAMLKFDPSERINMAAVLAHAFFDGFDLDAVRNETFEPDWLPPKQKRPASAQKAAKVFDSSDVEAFDGDQALFAGFDW